MTRQVNKIRVGPQKQNNNQTTKLQNKMEDTQAECFSINETSLVVVAVSWVFSVLLIAFINMKRDTK